MDDLSSLMMSSRWGLRSSLRSCLCPQTPALARCGRSTYATRTSGTCCSLVTRPGSPLDWGCKWTRRLAGSRGMSENKRTRATRAKQGRWVMAGRGLLVGCWVVAHIGCASASGRPSGEHPAPPPPIAEPASPVRPAPEAAPVAVEPSPSATAPPAGGPPPPPEPPSQPPPSTAARPDGAACSLAAECASGICEGQGCGPEQGRCAPRKRVCTMDLKAYCGCDGRTFRSSGSCPGLRFTRRGPCDGDAGPFFSPKR